MWSSVLVRPSTEVNAGVETKQGKVRREVIVVSTDRTI